MSEEKKQTHWAPPRKEDRLPISARLRRAALPAGIIVLALAAVAAVAMLVPERDREQPPQPRPPKPVEILEIRPLPAVPDTFTLSAVVEPRRIVDVAAEVAGRVTKIHSEEGRPCKAGDLVAELDKELIGADYERAKGEMDALERQRKQLEAQLEADRESVEQAKAQLRLDETEYARRKRLQAQKAVAEIEVEQARTKVEADQAALRAAQARTRASEQGLQVLEANITSVKAALSAAATRLERTEIAAPIDGIMNRIVVEEGEYVVPGTAIVRIVDLEKVKIVVQVPERDIGYLELGDPVVIERDYARNVLRSDGRITYIGFLADERTRTTPVEVEVDNPGLALRTGQIVRVKLTRMKVPDAVMIPLRAVIPWENMRVVYVVDEDGLARRIEDVRFGFFTDQYVLVTGDSLKPGDRLIVKGKEFVSPGQKVEIVGKLPPITLPPTGPDETVTPEALPVGTVKEVPVQP